MGAIANCCCCCGTIDTPTAELTLPANGIPGPWVEVSDCCKRREWLFPADQWSYLCSAPTHSDYRYETLTRDVYVRAVQYIRAAAGDTTGDVNCGISKKTGLNECSYNGTLISCGAESLCTTVSDSRTLERKRYLAARWRPLKLTLSLVRENLQCTGDESPSCKWILVAKLQVQIQYGHILSTSDVFSRTFSGSPGCCSCDDPPDVNSPHLDCEELTSFPNDVFVTLTRSREFDSEPTGVVTFSLDDAIACGSTPGVIACAGTITGDDSVLINSTDTTFNYPYTEPSISTNTYNVTCKTVIEFDNGCTVFNSVGTVTSCAHSSDLLPFLGCGLDQNTANATCWRACVNPATGLTAYYPKFDFDSSHVECTLHTFGHTSQPYVARSLVIDGGTWSVTLS